MSIRPMYINAHGDDYHFISLCIGTKICVDRGYKILDGQWFKSKEYYKGEPDIYFEKTDKGYSEGKRCTIKQRYVIEIETNPTKHSIELKQQQFKESVVDHELLIIDMRLVKNKNDWIEIQRFLEIWIP